TSVVSDPPRGASDRVSFLLGKCFQAGKISGEFILVEPESPTAARADLYSGVVPSTESPPILADAADVLSDQLREHLVRLSSLIKPHAGYLDERFRRRIRGKKYDQKQLKALSAITPGAAAKILGFDRPPADFFEQVDYSG